MLVEPSILASMAISCSKPFSEVFPLASFPLFTVCTISSLSGSFPSKEMLSVNKGVRRGVETSPSLFNNAIIEAQQVIKPSCFFRGINLSLLNFADDILHVSR